ncbi:MAG: long-chain-fatty-acid--CoA ligase [Rhodoferax sp.]
MYLTQALHRAVQQFPDRAAVRFLGKQRSYREFAERVARLAGALQQLGMRPGDRVGMLGLNSDLYLEYQMGVVWGGGALNPCNIRWSPAEIAYSLDDCDTQILLVDAMFAPMVEKLRASSKVLREVIYCGDGATPAAMHSYEALLEASAPVPDAGRNGNDLAGVFYTGGTTGHPKGVMLSHANLYFMAMVLVFEGATYEGATYLHAAPMFHLADYGATVGSWFAGSTHSIIPMYSPEAVLQAIERDQVNIVTLVPTMIQMLLDHPSAQQARDLSSLRKVIYGASPISEAVLDRALAAFKGVEFLQAYGMTEVTSGATILKPWYHTAEGRKLGKLRSAGRANCIVEIRIVDPLDQEVPRGTVGEILIKGPGVMLGYWNKPQETAQALRGGWMHTGDGGYMDADGFVFIADRLKDMIISGGENVYSAEVENAISQHPAVAAVAVIGIPSEKWGESVHAAVVCKPAQVVTQEDLIAYCKQLIAGYKCPRSVDFVAALPLSGAGKVLKTKLREPYWQGKQRGVA